MKSGDTIESIRNEITKILEANNCDYHIVELTKGTAILSNGLILTGGLKTAFVRFRVHQPYHYRYSIWFNPDTTEEDRLADRKAFNLAGSVRGGITCQARHGSKIKNNLNTGVPWNKGKHTGQTPWNKGLTKDTNETIRKSLSEGRKGHLNPAYGRIRTIEDREAQSRKMKAKILDGSFTPKSNNSRSHWTAKCLGRAFRSTWEAAFWYANQQCVFEKLRLSYVDEFGKQRVFITDFSDGNSIYEVGPASKIPDKQYKQRAAIDQGYNFTFITEVEIMDIINTFSDVDFDAFDSETSKRLKYMVRYATRKKNQNSV